MLETTQGQGDYPERARSISKPPQVSFRLSLAGSPIIERRLASSCFGACSHIQNTLTEFHALSFKSVCTKNNKIKKCFCATIGIGSFELRHWENIYINRLLLSWDFRGCVCDPDVVVHRWIVFSICPQRVQLHIHSGDFIHEPENNVIKLPGIITSPGNVLIFVNRNYN